MMCYAQDLIQAHLQGDTPGSGEVTAFTLRLLWADSVTGPGLYIILFRQYKTTI